MIIIIIIIITVTVILTVTVIKIIIGTSNGIVQLKEKGTLYQFHTHILYASVCIC